MTLRDMGTAAHTLSWKFFCVEQEKKIRIQEKDQKAHNSQMPPGSPRFYLWQIHKLLCLPTGLTLILAFMIELWKAGEDFHMLLTRESLFALY